MTMKEETRCDVRNHVTGSQCQKTKHEGDGHTFPIDDKFLQMLDDGELMIGRPLKRL